MLRQVSHLYISLLLICSACAASPLGKSEDEVKIEKDGSSRAHSSSEDRDLKYASVVEIIDQLGTSDPGKLYATLIPKSVRYTEKARFYEILSYLMPAHKVDKCKLFWDEIYKVDMLRNRLRPTHEQNLQRQLIINLMDLCQGEISMASLQERLDMLNQSPRRMGQHRKDDHLFCIDSVIEEHLDQLREIYANL